MVQGVGLPARHRYHPGICDCQDQGPHREGGTRAGSQAGSPADPADSTGDPPVVGHARFCSQDAGSGLLHRVRTRMPRRAGTARSAQEGHRACQEQASCGNRAVTQRIGQTAGDEGWNRRREGAAEPIQFTSCHCQHRKHHQRSQCIRQHIAT